MSVAPQQSSGAGTAGTAASSSSGGTAAVKNWGARSMDRGGLVVWVATVVSVLTLVVMWWTESFL